MRKAVMIKKLKRSKPGYFSSFLCLRRWPFRSLANAYVRHVGDGLDGHEYSKSKNEKNSERPSPALFSYLSLNSPRAKPRNAIPTGPDIGRRGEGGMDRIRQIAIQWENLCRPMLNVAAALM